MEEREEYRHMVGKTFRSEEEAFLFYNDYAKVKIYNGNDLQAFGQAKSGPNGNNISKCLKNCINYR
jgi:hypothetical protein